MVKILFVCLLSICTLFLAKQSDRTLNHLSLKKSQNTNDDSLRLLLINYKTDLNKFKKENNIFVKKHNDFTQSSKSLYLSDSNNFLLESILKDVVVNGHLISKFENLLKEANSSRENFIEILPDLKDTREKIVNYSKRISQNIEEFENDIKNANHYVSDESSDKIKNNVNKENIEKKVKTGFSQFRFKQNSYDIFIVDLAEKEKKLSFYLINKQGDIYGNINNLRNELKRDGKILLFATNGGMYMKDGFPQGLFVSNGKEITQVDLKREVRGEFLNFYIQPNGIFYINDKNLPNVCTTEEYTKADKLKVNFATQSGPMLISHGNININFNKDSRNVNIRNGVGLLEDGRIIFIISNEPVTFYDFSLVFKEYKCKDALYLDGAISKMYVQGQTTDNELYGNLGPLIGLVVNAKQ